jgi:hypothetical protein
MPIRNALIKHGKDSGYSTKQKDDKIRIKDHEGVDLEN